MIVATDRLVLDELTLADAPFILELVNEPAFIAKIRDSGVRTLEDAERYLREGPMASYARHGYGLWRVSLRETDEAIGMCGLVRRDTLDAPDIGFAFLERVRGRGYASEAALEVMAHARKVLGLTRILGVTAPHNEASAAVLRKAGLHEEGPIDLAGRPSRLFVWP